ncbi:MAG: hypothetical protein IT564_11945, partial [Rhodospirillales bacterium]|nr:hypothetical protein [Rhodospirillales bacterium]
MRIVSRYAISLVLACLLGGCFSNDPYPESDTKKNIYYSTFSGEPRRLDPAQSYSEDEYNFLNQIYEPPLQYHFLKRPYELEPLTLARMPKITAFDAEGQALADDAPAERIAKVVWELTVKPGIGYQNHPCFAKNSDGTYAWHLGTDGVFPAIAHPNELQPQGFREVTAEDYIYQMKRLAHPSLHCPIFGTLADHVAGFAEFQEQLAQEISAIRKQRREAGGVFYNQETDERDNPIWLDLRAYDIPGLKVVDRYTFQIILNDRYPQLKYWLAMPFFAPMPWEADRFFSQAAASKQNLTLNRF